DSFYFENGTGVIIQSTRQRGVYNQLAAVSLRSAIGNQIVQLFYTRQTRFICCQQLFQLIQLLFVSTGNSEEFFYQSYLAFFQPPRNQFFLYLADTNFIQLIDGNGDVGYFFGAATNCGQRGQ